MSELDKLVDKHLTLTNDDLCDSMGHELISRACVHCGLTIHQISDANDGVLPMRETPQRHAEEIMIMKSRLRGAQHELDHTKKVWAEQHRAVDEIKEWLETHKDK
jgi:hypothetical protein